MGIGSQSTLGRRHFAGKYMYDKLTKCPNFIMIKARKKINKIPAIPEFYLIFARKIFFPNLGAGRGQVPFCPLPPPYYTSMS